MHTDSLEELIEVEAADGSRDFITLEELLTVAEFYDMIAEGKNVQYDTK